MLFSKQFNHGITAGDSTVCVVVCGIYRAFNGARIALDFTETWKNSKHNLNFKILYTNKVNGYQ